MARALMFQGTGSDVGKTVLVAGLCRVAERRGICVRPFKPQNMSNNAAVAADGGEIGRGQWLQALAARVKPSVHMNPVLLKPQSETGSQIIVQGKMAGKANGRDYLNLKKTLLTPVMESFNHLKKEADLILVEGAGSPAEINLRAGDIANMGFARQADVPVILIGDIDRGGVIASIVGTHTILDPLDLALIEGFIINKFRGDPHLFEDGVKAISNFTGWRSFGVVPWISEVCLLPAEDSVALEKQSRKKGEGIKIAVPVTSRIANFDDLDPLMHEEGVDVVLVRKNEAIPEDAALILLPGSKSTIADMSEMEENGWAAQIKAHAKRGKPVIGLCGGYQMLGQRIADPLALEGKRQEIAGLGLLNINTVMGQEKTIKTSKAHSLLYDMPLDGYEIHMGKTTGPDCETAVIFIDGKADGAMSKNGLIWGTYLHGLFENGAFRKRVLAEIGACSSGKNHLDSVNAALDAIADALETALDIDALFALAR